MYLKRLELLGFKSFARKCELEFSSPVTAIVGPNGSGKSNVAEAFRFVLGEQSMKSMRTKRGEDLIFNGSRSAGRMNRASVTVVFDNQHHIFPVDYEEVSLTREVHRDGVNRYLINGAQVRLKDVLELLASARIGSSQHHIISQGEADRVLSVNAQERRAMIEDALGLRIYQFKKSESERKLKKTEDNLTQVRTLQKEIEPHLKFLEKQVKRIEQARALREELVFLAQEYFFREEVFLGHFGEEAEKKKRQNQEVLERLDAEIHALRSSIEEAKEGEQQGQVLELESKIAELRSRREEITRRLGRVEGMIESERKRREEFLRRKEEGKINETIEYRAVSDFLSFMEEKMNEILESNDLEKIKEGMRAALQELHHFLEEHKTEEEAETFISNFEELEAEQRMILEDVKRLEAEEAEQHKASEDLQRQMQQERGRFRGVEREIFEKMTARNDVLAALGQANAILQDLHREKEIFESDLSEFAMLVSKDVLKYREFVLPEGSLGAEEEDRNTQRDRRRMLERKKIKVEEMGGSGEEVLSEYEQLKEREAFFSREVEDLEKSKTSLETLIADLENQLDTEFKDGLLKINDQFQEFFTVIFGGGKASLELVKERKKKKAEMDDLSVEMAESQGPEAESGEEAEPKEGLEVSLSLPQKRIRGIEMLSGGERSLTSVALLFAISQVNPPPFLILDETDAALDESNSRRYGDMLEALSGKTQLIIITHNRETMSKAEILYGVTVGQDAVSKVLSVKFEDAAQRAAR
ncbi:MAG TPA: AAA family ATPase [Candidatus Paceibacterota bacterium]|nr:AAA family ATPase [Candidatus Paceibacterota bacterium]